MHQAILSICVSMLSDFSEMPGSIFVNLGTAMRTVPWRLDARKTGFGSVIKYANYGCFSLDFDFILSIYA